MVSIGLLLCQKVENCKDNGYLKMAPCDSPSTTGVGTNLSGLITQVWSLSPYIWQLVVVTDVADVTDRHFQKLSRPPFHATFDGESHGSIHSCSFSRRNNAVRSGSRNIGSEALYYRTHVHGIKTYSQHDARARAPYRRTAVRRLSAFVKRRNTAAQLRYRAPGCRVVFDMRLRTKR